ncbi:prepilin-type N-terminal cleavage/methylation domain-containing protein [Actinoplanes sp. NPDC049599]|uniref:type IV pilus modification PilV family protein n=1 Tax=Actinoplanes sp. NPDC049599 TaxID=3363903 RepID=UPI003791DECC
MAVRKDDGFTLVEVLTSLAVIGVVLSAVTTFFVRSMVTIDVQGARQAAIQVAADSMEQLRQVAAADVAGWLSAQSATPTVIVNSLTYNRLWTSGVTVTDLLNVTVKITWRAKNCPSAGCTYATSTQISTASREPVFNSATGS